MSRAKTESRAAALAALQEEFGRLLGAERRLRARNRAGNAEDGLTTSYARVLSVLDENGEATSGQIARAAGVSTSRVTHIVDHFVKAGIVTRVRSTADRRHYIIAITDPGRAAVAERRRRWGGDWEEALADVPTGDLKVTAEVTKRIQHMLEHL